jgi:hypothetical protein
MHLRKIIFLLCALPLGLMAQVSDEGAIKSSKLQIPFTFSYFNVGTQAYDFSNLNRELNTQGFQSLEENLPMFGVGIGGFHKRHWFAGDFNMHIGNARKDSSGSRYLNVNAFAMNFRYGYDILHHRNFQIIPYAGVSGNFVYMSTGNSQDSVSQFLQAPSVHRNIWKSLFTVQPGLQVQYAMYGRKKAAELPAMVIGARCGYDVTIAQDGWRQLPNFKLQGPDLGTGLNFMVHVAFHIGDGSEKED